METCKRDDERGQTLPLVALMLLVLMGMLALALDGGYAYAQRRFMQNAADAGALAAVTQWASGELADSVLRQTATTYAQLNRASSATMVYLDADKNLISNPGNNTVPANAKFIQVTASRTFPTFFARVLGINTLTASAQAAARAYPAGTPWAISGLAPLGVPDTFYNACTVSLCDLWDPNYFKDWGIPAGDFKTLIDLSQGTAETSNPTAVSDWTLYGYPGYVAIGDWIPAIGGSFGNNVADSIRTRVIASGLRDPDGVPWGEIDLVIWHNFQLPDRIADTPTQVQVLNFGRFKVRYTDIQGSRVVGHFIDYVVPGYYHGGGDPGPGPRTVLLAE